MKKRITAIILIATLILGCFTVASFGASPKKKMTSYYEVLKKGNTVYCSAGNGIYKVNLKNGKATTSYGTWSEFYSKVPRNFSAF